MNPGRTFAVTAAIVVLLIAGGAFSAFSYYNGQVHDARRVGQPAAVIDIPAGAGVSGVGDILARRGVIGSTLAFEVYVRTSGLTDQLEAGHFSIPGGLSMAGALALITHAQGNQVTVTIPEGYTTKQIAALLQSKGLFSSAAYIAAVNGGNYTQPFLAGHVAGYGLEGYLFPDTFFFDPHAAPADVIAAQLAAFDQHVPADLRAHASDHGLTFAQVVVLASIVERESKFDADRAYVAAVFYNRIAQGLPLQSDATVAYAKGQSSTEITDQDKALNSPFNTYLHAGLPPGAISNPGLASIRAALAPASGWDYIYFLTDPSGHAHFSRTLAQHQLCQVDLAACPTVP